MKKICKTSLLNTVERYLFLTEAGDQLFKKWLFSTLLELLDSSKITRLISKISRHFQALNFRGNGDP